MTFIKQLVKCWHCLRILCSWSPSKLRTGLRSGIIIILTLQMRKVSHRLFKWFVHYPPRWQTSVAMFLMVIPSFVKIRGTFSFVCACVYADYESLVDLTSPKLFLRSLSFFICMSDLPLWFYLCTCEASLNMEHKIPSCSNQIVYVKTILKSTIKLTLIKRASDIPNNRMFKKKKEKTSYNKRLFSLFKTWHFHGCLSFFFLSSLPQFITFIWQLHVTKNSHWPTFTII